VEHERRRVVRHELLGAGIVIVREHTRRRLGGRDRRESGESHRGDTERGDLGHRCELPPRQDDTTRGTIDEHEDLTQ
jgi:hypothetical protein